LLGGDREELIARCRALDPNVKCWTPDEERREILHENDDAYVRFVANFLQKDPAMAPFLSDGLAELTIVRTAGDGTRYKARPDYLTWHTVADLKNFGKPPKRGQGLRLHCVREAAFNGADLQAVHNYEMVRHAAAALTKGKLQVHNHQNNADGWDAETKLAEMLDRIDAHMGEEQPRKGGGGGQRLMFRWLFVRMGGAPSSIVLPFRCSDAQWTVTEQDIRDAIAEYKKYRATCGDGIWAAALGEVEIEDEDWPRSIVREPS
jgi:hypothetical protein